jgi:DNA replication protein DnaC
MSYSDQHYGEGDPTCEICGGLGYVRYDVPENHQHFGKIFRCNCRQEQADSARIAHLRKQGGLEHLANKTFENFKPEGIGQSDIDREKMRIAYDLAVSYAENPHGWLVLKGGFGCGKTHLAAAIANVQIEAGRSVLFMTVPDLLDYLKASYGASAADTGDNFNTRFEQILNVSLLILDDMGTESPTPWAMEKLFQILNHRYTAQLPTVVSTNRDLEQFDPRIQSRLEDVDLSQVLTITAPDYRTAGGRNSGDLNVLGMYSNLTFDNFRLERGLNKRESDNLRSAYEAAKQFAQNVYITRAEFGPDMQTEIPEAEKELRSLTPWLIFAGPHGSGKTHLAAAIATTQRKMGAGVIMATVPDLLDHLRATFAPNSPISFDMRFNELKEARLLVLDDLGTEAATPWAKAKLYQLFDYRYVLRLPTVVTTAYNLEEIDKLVDPGLVARMRDKRVCRFMPILADAYRGERQESLPL